MNWQDFVDAACPIDDPSLGCALKLNKHISGKVSRLAIRIRWRVGGDARPIEMIQRRSFEPGKRLGNVPAKFGQAPSPFEQPEREGIPSRNETQGTTFRVLP